MLGANHQIRINLRNSRANVRADHDFKDEIELQFQNQETQISLVMSRTFAETILFAINACLQDLDLEKK